MNTGMKKSARRWSKGEKEGSMNNHVKNKVFWVLWN